MYKVTKEFIYRAKLYPVGRELTEREYERMMQDKVAIRRGIPDKVALPAPPAPVVMPEEIVVPKVVDKKEVPTTVSVAKKPAAKKPAAAATKKAPTKKAPAKKAPAKKK